MGPVIAVPVKEEKAKDEMMSALMEKPFSLWE